MNILYLIGLLILLVILGYPYLILAVANNQQGSTRTLGRLLSGVFVLALVVTIVLFQTGIVQMPALRFSPERPSTRMMRGVSGYLTGMMAEDERAIDEFVNALKANPTLYEKLKQRIK